MTAAYLSERAEWCVALARQISDRPAADALRIDAAAYLVRAGRMTLREELRRFGIYTSAAKSLVSAPF